MKQTFWICMLIALISCSKENQKTSAEAEEKKFEVSFNVSSDFSTTLEDVRQTTSTSAKTAQDSLKESVKYIYYVVHRINSSNQTSFVKKIYQTAADTNFGIILDSLSIGKYVISILGSAEAVATGPSYYALNDGSIDRAVFTFPGTDAFFKKVTINVNGNINDFIHLDRIVSKVKIRLTDNISAEATNISIFPQAPSAVSGLGLPRAFVFSTGMVTADGGFRFEARYPPMTQTITDSLRGMPDYTKEFYILSTDTAHINISITSSNAQNTVIAGKTIKNVPIQPGKKTVLEGKLFEQSSIKGINVVVDNPGWKDSTVVVF